METIGSSRGSQMHRKQLLQINLTGKESFSPKDILEFGVSTNTL